MRLFKKESENDEPAQWSLGHMAVDGHQVFVRIRTTTTRKSTRRWRVGIAVTFQGVADGQYPDAEAANRLSVIEDLLVEHMGHAGAELVLVLTLPNVREYVFYASRPTNALAAVRTANERIPSADIQAYAQEDAAWSTYHRFAEGFVPNNRRSRTK